VSQNKPFVFVSLSSQIFCHHDRKLTNTTCKEFKLVIKGRRKISDQMASLMNFTNTSPPQNWRTLPNSFYEVRVTLITKARPRYDKKRKLQTNISYELDAKILNKILANTTQKYIKRMTM
jgi:hypothetical protein